MRERKKHSAFLVAGSVFAVAVAALLLMPGLKQRGHFKYRNYVSYLPAPATAQAAELNAWTQAVQEVKADRSEPTGRQAKVEIPQQVRHYTDTRRFLAIQVAEWRKHRFQTPRDFVDLAAMIHSGEMVTLPQVSENYILFGVGGSADKDPFTRYEGGKRIALYGEGGLRQEYTRITESRAGIEREIVSLKRELSSIKKRERSTRVKLQSEIVEKEKALKAEREAKELLDRYYGDAERRRKLFADYESLESVADDFPGSSSRRRYDIGDARGRRDMKVRMLSALRPEALKVLEEVALSYRQQFDRPLPITSLVRPDEYQHLLSKVNPNATRIETPPHSTGLAFDIFYRFMTAAEQAHVMAHLARLKDEGRIEVLRENRDHYHVFAFVDGERPDEKLIVFSLRHTGGAASATVKTQQSKTASNKDKKKSSGRVAAKRERNARRRKR